MTTKHYVEELCNLRKNRKLIPFVGAGLSMNLGLPSYPNLIDSIADELGYDPEVYKLNGTNLQLAEYYVAMKGSIGPLRSIMDRSFNPSDDSIRNSAAHTALAQMDLP